MQATAKIKVLIIGTGNVGTWLLKQLHTMDHYDLYVTNRSGILPSTVHTDAYTWLPASDSHQFDIILLAVPDDAIHSTYLKWQHKATYLVHFSGTLDLHNDQLWYGWPIYSIHEGIDKDARNQIPFVIHAETPPLLLQLFRSLNNHIHLLSVEQKTTLHLCSVVANNFTNAIMAEVQKLLNREGISITILEPLIKQTFQQILSGGNLKNLQTGPAARQDHSTLARHVAILEEKDPTFKAVYESLSTFIIHQHLKKD